MTFKLKDWQRLVWRDWGEQLRRHREQHVESLRKRDVGMSRELETVPSGSTQAHREGLERAAGRQPAAPCELGVRR